VALTVLPSTDLYLMGRQHKHDHNVTRGVVPAHKLLHHGVNCSLSSNNILNPFTPFGDCSQMRMANLYANISRVGKKAEHRKRQPGLARNSCVRPADRLRSRAYTDEMAYSLNGENVHYGTPTNPRAPGRIPGGSSSGSAVAVAGSLVGFAFGTDCGGSVRLPASYCGIFGIRTTRGLVPVDGVVDLAASFDTVGWFAREPQTLRRVGDVRQISLPCRTRKIPDQAAGSLV
jgi:hypothetical protein